MCRNIKVLVNFEPMATHDEIRASALQFVRKLSGTTKPSRANEAAHRLVHSMISSAPPKNREIEAQKARERSLRRFA